MTKHRVNQLAWASLLLMAMLWGSSFVVTKGTLDRLPPADLLAMRYLIAFIVLAAFAGKHLRMSGRTFRNGAIMGGLYAVGQLTQTTGLGMTAASVSGFLTGTYVVFTPLLASVLFRSRLGRKIWLGVCLAIIGLAVLSIRPDSSGFGLGETLTLVSAICFAAHIIATGHFVTPKNAMSLTLSQTGVVVVIYWALSAPKGITMPQLLVDWGALLYLAVIAGAATLFLQNWAQAYIEPTKAAVIMCSEPLWAAFFAVVLGSESVTWQMVVGGGAILSAMYLVVGNASLPRLSAILFRKSKRVTEPGGEIHEMDPDSPDSRGDRLRSDQTEVEASLRQGA